MNRYFYTDDWYYQYAGNISRPMTLAEAGAWLARFYAEVLP